MHKEIQPTKLLAFFQKNANKRITLAKLAKTLRIKKHNYAKLKSILFQLEKNGKIQNKGKKYYVSSIMHTIQGIFDASALAKNYPFAFVKTEKQDIKISVDDCLNAFHGDKVEVIITKRAHIGSSGRIVKITERKNRQIIGNIVTSGNKIFLSPGNYKIDKNIELIDTKAQIVGKKVIVNITDWGDRTKGILPRGKVVEILGDSNDPKIDFLSVMKQYDLSEKFPKSDLQEIENLSELIDKTEIDRRNDFRNLITFTIDPITAKDFDDAISLEEIPAGYRLYVHIADVSHYVDVDSPIFNEAFRRGTSIYLLQNVIPMLATKLSNDLCCLQPNLERLTISVIIDYDKNFKVLHRKVVPSIIRSDARLNYEQVDRLFEERNENEIEPKVKEILLKMRPLANYLTEQRYARGGLDFDLPDSEFIFDENGSPINILRIKETESHLLIEEFMLEANKFIAELIAKKCNAAIFRIHEPPDPAKMGAYALLVKSYNYTLSFSSHNQNLAIKSFLSSLQNENHHRVFDNLLLRSLMKAKYSYRNIGHFGLALKSYTHFTSPIRRFPDLVVHHLLKQYIFGWSDSRFSLTDIKQFAQKSSEMEIIALNAERALEKMKKNRFMSENIGKSFKALIVNFNQKNIFVELDEYPIEGFIPLSSIADDYYLFNSRTYSVVGKRKKRKFFLCQQIKVSVKSVENNIEFEVI